MPQKQPMMTTKLNLTQNGRGESSVPSYHLMCHLSRLLTPAIIHAWHSLLEGSKLSKKKKNTMYPFQFFRITEQERLANTVIAHKSRNPVLLPGSISNRLRHLCLLGKSATSLSYVFHCLDIGNEDKKTCFHSMTVELYDLKNNPIHEA